MQVKKSLGTINIQRKPLVHFGMFAILLLVVNVINCLFIKLLTIGSQSRVRELLYPAGAYFCPFHQHHSLHQG
jgi:hypothetical protein